MAGLKHNLPMFVWEHEKTHYGKEVHATIRLFDQTWKEYSHKHNLQSGLYALWRGNHSEHAYVRRPRDIKDGEVPRSYFATYPNVHEGQETSDCCCYVWERTYNNEYAYIKHVRELLPFEKIELMFEMVQFCKTYKDVFWKFHKERPQYKVRNFDLCSQMWNADYCSSLDFLAVRM